MGQKINPISFRLGVNKTWNSRWYAKGEQYVENILQDHLIRKFLNKKAINAGVANIVIERISKKVLIELYVSRPGVVIGKKGSEIEELKKELSKIAKGADVALNIVPVKNPDLDAKLVALSIARQIEKRVSYRKAMKKAMQQSLKAGVKGIRICTKGRLAEADMARKETYKEGRVPLHTIRADIDYATSEAFTTYGIIGTKVWLYKGDIVDKTHKEKNIIKNKSNISDGALDNVKS